MAKQNHALILSKSTFTEEWFGQRNWTQPISPLQYAAWAGDTVLVDIFLNILPTNLIAESLQQLQDVKNNCLERMHLSAVKELLQEYKEYQHYFNQDSLQLILKEKQINRKQFHSVVNLIQWFCSSIPFDPVPTFSKFPESRQTFIWIDYTQHRNVLDLNKINNDWGLYKAEHRYCSAIHSMDDTGSLSRQADCEAIGHFCKVRSQDLAKQITALQTILKTQTNPEQKKSHCLVM